MQSLKRNNGNIIRIHDIQGCGHRSSYAGRMVFDIRGVVTWKSNNGFYMQDVDPDNDFCSSEGIFVFTDQFASVLPGDLIGVNGQVEEYFPGAKEDHYLSVTEIISDNYKIISSKNQLPEPFKIPQDAKNGIPNQVIEDDKMTIFDPSSDGLDFWESLEGMLIEIDGAVVVGPRNSFGEVFVIPDSMIQKNIISKEGALIHITSDTNPEKILVDLPSSFKESVNLGSTFTTPIIGVIDYAYGNYRILEMNSPDITNKDVQFEKLDPVQGNSIRIASYNVNNLNRFDENRIKKIAGQIVKNLASPDILVLQEIQDDSGAEDDGTTTAQNNLEALIVAIQKQKGPDYAFIDSPIIDSQSGGAYGSNIRTVILYRKGDQIQPEGCPITSIGFDEDVFSGSRLPLICKFNYQNQPFYVIGVHFISNNLNSPLFGSIQPIDKPEANKRLSQGEQVTRIVRKILDINGEIPVLILGDFNDVSESETLKQFYSHDFIDSSILIDTNERYSILFEGNAELYDHILIDRKFSNLLQKSWILHLNTGWDERKQQSDHDPVIIEIDFSKVKE